MKKIILIGGSGVLGKHFAQKLSKNNLVHVADVGLKKEQIADNRYNHFLDVLNEKKVDEFFKKIKKKYGAFDILINNAAFTTEMSLNFSKLNKKEHFSTKIWEKTINTNLTGPFLCCKYFLKYHHNKRIDQRVINIGTIYGMYSPHHYIYTNQNFFSSISYTAGKAGLIGMTKWLATKFAKEKTNFNMISPAGVFNNQNKKFLKDYTRLIPKKKMATEEQIFSAIEFLISNNADYVIGQNILVDGGFSAW